MARALDIFCGAGGSSHGIARAGVGVAAGVDMNEIATATFSANFPGAHVVTERLELIEPEALKEQIGSIDLMVGSPECTNHTPAKGSAVRSEESRATAMQLVRYASVFRPQWLVMENVVNMRPWARYGELKDELRALGYGLQEQIIDAADLGVPQSRRRLFLLAEKGIVPSALKLPDLERRGTVREILAPAGTYPVTLIHNGRRALNTIARAERGFEALGRHTPFIMVYYGSDGAGGFQTLDRPLRTITTVDRFALIEPSPAGPTMRMLQPDELKRAMGFLPGYQFPLGVRRDKIRLLGNGVCPPVMEALVSHLLDASGQKSIAA